MNIPQVDLTKYTIIRKIGYGSYGQVYLIQDNATQKQYASKIYLHEYSQNNDFYKELNILSKKT